MARVRATLSQVNYIEHRKFKVYNPPTEAVRRAPQ
jgi:hypothetical protein